jgi:sec-independent protein translocase protein TatB
MGLSLPEILVVAVIALMVIGPKDLPQVMRQLGRMVGKAKRFAESWMDEVPDHEARDAAAKQPVQPTHIVIGDDGKPYEAYAITEIVPASKKKEETKG